MACFEEALVSLKGPTVKKTVNDLTHFNGTSREVPKLCVH